jgi:solute carrier family 35 protein E1
MTGKEPTLIFIACGTFYTIGFVTLNLSMTYMEVPLAMTLRAAEPLVGFVIGKFVMSKQPSTLVGLSLVPIAVGCGLCSFSAVDFSPLGFFLVMLSNCSFACRSIFSKQIQSKYQIKGVELFGQICLYGSMLQAVLLTSKVMFVSGEPDLTQFSSRLMINGFLLWTYLTCSFIMLSKVNPITHIVLNSLRRPVIIAASAIYFGLELNTLQIIGIAIACIGSLCYGQAKSMDAKAQSGAKPKSS